jgi:hypothetical protein
MAKFSRCAGAFAAGLSAFAATLVQTSEARAEDAPSVSAWGAPKSETFDAGAWARLRFNALSDFPLDTVGTRNDQRAFLESRLRAFGAWTPSETFVLKAEVDAFSGVLAGDKTALGTVLASDTLRYRLDRTFGLGWVDLRQLYFAWRLPFGELRVGQQAFSWGLGLLANGGEGEPDFGDRRYGDLVERVAFGTKPFVNSDAGEFVKQLSFFVGGDLVRRDENAELTRGDVAFQGVFGVRSQTEPVSAGLFASARTQKDKREVQGRPIVQAAAVDAYASVRIAKLDDARAFRAEGEVAAIAGRTTRPYLDDTRDGASVRSFGGVLRLRYDDTSLRLVVKNEVGYASGDNDPRDDTVRTFTFDPDYKVGLILFDQVLARLSARAIDRAADPTLVAIPPSGTRYLVTQGAVTNAVYMHPVVRYRPAAPFEVRLGYLFAYSAGDLVDPFSSAQAGGFNATYGGRSPGSRSLGQEVDLGLHYTIPLGESGAVARVGAEGGLFFAGAAFDGVGGGNLGTVWMGRLLGDVRF